MASMVKLIELAVFPSFCKRCNTLLVKKGERGICAECLKQLKPWQSGHCMECGRFFSSPAESHVCGRCVHDRPMLSKHRSVGLYAGVLKDSILLFKYKGYKCLGKDLALYAHRFSGNDSALWQDVDLIVPVPLHRRKLGKRGFNQAQVLARILSEKKRIPMDGKALKKVRQSPPQTSLEAEDRVHNLTDVFRVAKPERVSGKTVLIVDDVFTTGTTLDECTRVLLEAGAREIRGLTVAQAAPV